MELLRTVGLRRCVKLARLAGSELVEMRRAEQLAHGSAGN